MVSLRRLRTCGGWHGRIKSEACGCRLEGEVEAWWLNRSSSENADWRVQRGWRARSEEAGRGWALPDIMGVVRTSAWAGAATTANSAKGITASEALFFFLVNIKQARRSLCDIGVVCDADTSVGDSLVSQPPQPRTIATSFSTNKLSPSASSSQPPTGRAISLLPQRHIFAPLHS